ncbi:MAG: hypothetical protein WAW61_11820, partial [Methylococcaceae bacterium]
MKAEIQEGGCIDKACHPAGSISPETHLMILLRQHLKKRVRMPLIRILNRLHAANRLRKRKTKMFTSPTLKRAMFLPLSFVGISTALYPVIGAAQFPAFRFEITFIRQIGENFDPTSFGDFYAEGSIDGKSFSSFDKRFIDNSGGFLVPTGYFPLDPPWVFIREFSPGQTSVPIHIELIDDDFLTRGEKADINPGSKEDVDIVVDLKTGKWSGDVEWPQNCIEGPGPLVIGLDSRSAGVCFSIDLDSDSDGLLDNWEQNGIDSNGDGTVDINLPAFGANPQRKDIFVEVDCLVAADHSHCPSKDAISDVVQSFARAPVINPDGTTGVQLHIDSGPLFGAGSFISVPGTSGVIGTFGDFGGGGNQINEAGNEIIDAFRNPLGSGTKFSDLRKDFFDSQRDLIFRYAIFGHQTNSRLATNDCTSGYANGIPGNEFIVTLGGFRTGTTPCWTPDANGFSVGNRLELAGTFQHELGHTLGLHHGGQDGVNEKPNYLSVMNYTHQYCEVPGLNSIFPGGCDYSRIALPPPVSSEKEPILIETDLDECAGIDRGLLGFGPMNWNGNKDLNNVSIFEGTTCPSPNTQNIAFDINNDKIVDSKKPLTGYSDWGVLKYSLEVIANAGSSGRVQVTDEADPDTIRQAREHLGELLAPDVAVDKTGPLTALPGEVLNYTTLIDNKGRGPALSAVLTDTGPDGGATQEELGAVVANSTVTRTSQFEVPDDACPGDFTAANASVAFKDFVSNKLVASGSAPLQILDAIPPTLTVTVSPSTLWPPDHKFRDVTATITLTDNCDKNPKVTLVSVTSNEPETGFLGNGDQGPDIQGAG